MSAAAGMADPAQFETGPHHDGGDTAKRRQIVAGARKVFLERGFEGASMGEIARVAGVSKGTLYVYFQNKEQMFCAILDEERRKHLETVFTLDDSAGVRETLVTFGKNLTRFITDPGKIAAMRTAMGIAERMPDVGRHFYERGPGATMNLLARYLDRKVAAGELAIADTSLAAAQFLDLCGSTLIRPALFGIELSPEERERRIETVVHAAADVFLRAYSAPGGHA
jgi:AcrR family transcriptional regulator